jgi:hypothetical protein
MNKRHTGQRAFSLLQGSYLKFVMQNNKFSQLRISSLIDLAHIMRYYDGVIFKKLKVKEQVVDHFITLTSLKWLPHPPEMNWEPEFVTYDHRKLHTRNFLRGHPKRTSANEGTGEGVWSMRTHVLILPVKLKGKILRTHSLLHGTR